MARHNRPHIVIAKNLSPENTPVIFAIGEAVHKIEDLADAKEPVDLMADAMRAAEQDADANILDKLDSVDVIGVVSWLYKDPASLLCDRLAINPRRCTKAGMGGEKPVRLLHEAALEIYRGEAEAIAIVGGEAQNSFRKARRSKTRFDWTPRASLDEAWGDIEDTTLGIREQACALGVQRAAHVYPFFENAMTASLGQTPTEAMQRSAELWAAYAAESANNAFSWSRKAFDAQAIATISETNRMVSFPYPKLMVANDSVNQAAAIIVTSLAFARAAGAAEDKLICFHGGAAANEPDDFLMRADLGACPAMEAVLDDVADQAGDAAVFDLAEIYSCFPVVPKLALEYLWERGFRDSVAPTVTGGLTFFGGPMNNYMTHAACAMTRKLRAGEGTTGLLYGQGGVMTKHHALVLSASPSDQPLNETYSVQDIADRAKMPSPDVLEAYEGPARIETYSAYYGSDGEPALGVVVGRTPDERRLIARTPQDNEETLSLLTDFDRTAIGVEGDVRLADGQMTWASG